ncbi:hypothetical protein [Pseudomonas sp.]|uniref:hypothetical protein n=1 Tax=Pseudomonas sp. TaxID=306 RepID=UPI00258829AF|nr:hypothetical protein [Pseudomonas sp.]
MIIPGDFPDLSELKRLADACPPAGNHHFESDELKAVAAFRDEVIRLFGCDAGMAKTLIDEIQVQRKGADRYQWLRDKSEAINQFYLSVPIWFSGVRFRKEDVDAAVDAAMGHGERS